MTDLPSFN